MLRGRCFAGQRKALRSVEPACEAANVLQTDL
jgi:hypothetical protein